MEFNGRSPQLKPKIMKMKEELSPETTPDAKEASSPVETIVMRESDKAINWEVHDSEITGHVFEGNGVYIIKKFHQGDYKYMVSWRDDRKYEIIKLKESDHLLSLMKWCVEHWQLSDDVYA